MEQQSGAAHARGAARHAHARPGVRAGVSCALLVGAAVAAGRASAAPATLSDLDAALEGISIDLAELSERVVGMGTTLARRHASLVASAQRLAEARRGRPAETRAREPPGARAAPQRRSPQAYAGGCSGPAGERGFYEPLANCRPARRSAASEARLAEISRLYEPMAAAPPTNLSSTLMQSLRNRLALQALRHDERLSRPVCARMLADRNHQFAAMWGTPRVKMAPTCAPPRELLARWVANMNDGAMCTRNWYEGTLGCVGQRVQPRYTTRAPALLGFDLHIIRSCNERNGCGSSFAVPGPQACIFANLLILSLYGSAPVYNMCRNLEWVVCAASGRLVAQLGSTLVFSPPPTSLTAAELFHDSRGNIAAYSVRGAAARAPARLVASGLRRAAYAPTGRVARALCVPRHGSHARADAVGIYP